MVDSLKLKYYHVAILQTNRGNSKGKIINAKPILLLALLTLIDRNISSDNKVFFNEEAEKIYNEFYSLYESNMAITPFYKPFFYLQSDGYWHIVWENGCENKPISAKYLRENVQYASFDNALWDLLQDEETRNYFREVIINHFFNQK